MFTGLIEEIGRVTRVSEGGRGQMISVRGDKIFGDLSLGDSVSVNGVCLTVDRLRRGEFASAIMPETARKTTLGQLRPGAAVNLERALLESSRMGGHFVLGHVDAVASVLSSQRQGQAVLLTMRAPAEIRPYLAPAGSIALEGVSLTLARVTRETFTVSLVRHTLDRTTLGQVSPGSRLNVEADVLGKYVSRMAGSYTKGQPYRAMDRAFLREHGWPL